MLHRLLLLRAAMVAACAALSCGAGLAAETVSLTFQEKDGKVKIEGSFLVEADRETAWEVLTDYGHIPRYIHNMKISRVDLREGNEILLHQEAEGGFLFVTQRVVLYLYVRENPRQSIQFNDISFKDFHHYSGSWRIEEALSEKQLKLVYQLDADRKFSAPAFLVNDAMHGGAKDLLKSVQKEILRRQAEQASKKPVVIDTAHRTTDPPTAENPEEVGTQTDTRTSIPDPPTGLSD